MADRSRDAAIRNHLEQALVTFTDDARAEQHTYWPGFAVYCMEVAVGFIRMHTDMTGVAPKGISRDALQAKTDHATNSITYREIKEYVSGAKINPDVQDFLAFVNGNLDPKIVQAEEKAARAAEEIETLRQVVLNEKSKTNVMDRHMQDNMKDLKSSVRKIESMCMADGAQLNLIHRLLDQMIQQKLMVFQKYLSELNELKDAQENEEVIGKINDLMKLFKTAGEGMDLGSILAEIKIRNDQHLETITNLRAENERLGKDNEQLQKVVERLEQNSSGLLLTPEMEVALDEIAFCSENVEKFSEHTKKFENFFQNPAFRDIMDRFGILGEKLKHVFEYTRNSMILIYCFRTVQTYRGDITLKNIINKSIKFIKERLRPEDTKFYVSMISLCLGFGDLNRFSRFKQRMNDKSIEFEKCPFWVLSDAGTSGDKWQLYLGVKDSDVDPRSSKCVTFIEFLQQRHELEMVQHKHLIIHLYRVLVMLNSTAQGVLKRHLSIIRDCISATCGIQNLDALINLGDLNVFFEKIISEDATAGVFPYMLFHSGHYNQWLDKDSYPTKCLSKKITGVVADPSDPNYELEDLDSLVDIVQACMRGFPNCKHYSDFLLPDD